MRGAVGHVLLADVAVEKQHAVVVGVDGGFHVVLAAGVVADGPGAELVTVPRKPSPPARLRRGPRLGQTKMAMLTARTAAFFLS